LLLIAIVSLIALLVILSVLPLPSDYNLYVVFSNSMNPTIQAGDLIFTKKTNDYQTGDIITFLPTSYTKPSESITHRIVSKKEEGGVNYYTTKGEANPGSDPNPIPEDNIKGKYLFRIPFLGYPVGYAKTLPGLVIFIIIPAVVIIYDEIHKLKREIIKRRKKGGKKKDEKRDSS